MIFITVGTQLPFDRLVRAVDEWSENSRRTDIFAQIGKASYVPRHFGSSHFLEPDEFQRIFEEASAIVAHAGMGTIISALKIGKPLLVMPRLARYGEQRNDHQLATATSFLRLGCVSTALNEQELAVALDRLDSIRPGPLIGDFASRQLLDAVRGFIFHSETR